MSRLLQNTHGAHIKVIGPVIEKQRIAALRSIFAK